MTVLAPAVGTVTPFAPTLAPVQDDDEVVVSEPVCTVWLLPMLALSKLEVG